MRFTKKKDSERQSEEQQSLLNIISPPQCPGKVRVFWKPSESRREAQVVAAESEFLA